MIEFSAATDKGMIRQTNQDFYVAGDNPVPLFILCDGMGGHEGGDIASKAAAESISKYISTHYSFDNDDEKAEKLLTSAVDYANKIVYSRAKKMPRYSDMGTTCEVCFIDFEMLYICHVGDSKVFLYRNNELTQLTKDHTLIEELLKSGSITKKEVQNHPARHVITRAVGTEETINSDFLKLELCDGDMILMCSDGLTDMLTNTAIKKIFLPGGGLQSIADKLVAKANENGGLDNITTIVLRYTKNEEGMA